MTDEEMTLSAKIQVYIKRGYLDNSFEDLYEAMDIRRKRKARDLFNELQPGDHVRVSNNIKPRYMAGQVGVIVAKRQSKLEVEFDRPMGRFGKRVIVPASSVTKVTKTGS